MTRILLAVFILPLSLMADLDIRNEEDRAIFKDAYSLSSILLSQNGKSQAGATLIKFAAWLHSEHKGVKDMRSKAVFGEKIESHGAARSSVLSKKLMARQSQIKDQSTRILYVVVAAAIDSTNNEAKGELKTMTQNGFDVSLNKLLKDAAQPELTDLAEDARKVAVREREIVKENNELKKAYTKDDRKKLSAAEIEKLLDLVKFKTFAYSEASMLDAINRVTHKLFWRGVQVTLSGNRISYTDIQKASNGALYYIGPLFEPRRDEFKLKDVTLRDLLSHFNINMDLEYSILDGEIALSDGELSDFSDMPEEGFAANDMQAVMKNFKISDLKKYRGKSFKMNGIVTGLGRGMDSRTMFFALDGGLTQLTVTKADLDPKVLKRLDVKIDAWKKSGGQKKYRDKVREMKKSGEEIERMSVVDPMMYITFKATCVGMDKGRLLFGTPDYITIKSSGEYLLAPKSKTAKKRLTKHVFFLCFYPLDL